ncbi:MAG: transglutaminase domain-containing protein [Bacteroidales bacterium]
MILKRTIISFLCVISFSLVSIQAFSNVTVDTNKVFTHVKKTPLSAATSVKDLSNYLTQKFSNDNHKVLAISYWLSENISYDFSFLKPAVYDSKEILQKKTTRAEGYATVFVDLCKQADIPAIVVYGYKRNFDHMNGDTLSRSNHAWALAKINNKWRIYDPCLASGAIQFEKDLFISAETVEKIIHEKQQRYVKKFNPAWLNVNPYKMSFTHHPLIPAFQLLKYPVPIKTFQHGKKAIARYLKKHKGVRRQNKAIDQYEDASISDRYLQAADEAHKHNPINVRDIVYLYNKSILHTKKDVYIPETENYLGSFEILRPMRYQAYMADSLKDIAEDNNDKEYDILKERSEMWEDTLIQYNKDYIFMLKDRGRELKKYVRTLEKMIDRLNKNHVEIQENRGIYPQEIIEAVIRPTEKDNDEMYEAHALKKELDSIAYVADTTLNRIFTLEDEVFEVLYSGSRKNQYKMNEYYQNITKRTKGILDYKKNTIQLVYYTNDTIKKPSIPENLKKADELTQAFIVDFVPALTEYQKASYKVIKNYTKVVDDQLDLIEDLKEVSYFDNNEDSLYELAVIEFEENLKRIEQITTIQQDQIGILSKMVQKQRNYINTSIEMLDIEQDYEKLRNDIYEFYIDNRAESEEELLDYIEDEVSDVVKDLDKTLNK